VVERVARAGPGAYARRAAGGATFLRSDALVVFFWSRLAIWVGALFALFAFDPSRAPYAARLDVPRLTHDLGSVTDVWARWDSIPYLQIAEHGYGGVKGSPAFYPLYPWIVGGVGRALGGHFVLAGIVVSLSATLVSFVLLHRLARAKLGEEGARRALVYLAIFPMSLFLQAIYAESLLLCLAVAIFLLAERERWPAAGALLGLAFLTRPTAIALVPAVAFTAWQSRHRLRAFLTLLVAPLLFLAYPLVLRSQFGNTWGFVHSERFWHRTVSPFGPFDGIWLALHAAWAGILQLTIGSAQHWYWTPVNPARAAVLNLEYLAYLVAFCYLAYVAWRSLGAAYGIFAFASLLIPLSAPSDTYPLLSLPRLGLTMFPVFLALAVVGRRQRAHAAIVACSAVLLGISVAEWATWQWVS
jgi:hypothetical protein